MYVHLWLPPWLGLGTIPKLFPECPATFVGKGVGRGVTLFLLWNYRHFKFLKFSSNRNYFVHLKATHIFFCKNLTSSCNTWLFLSFRSTFSNWQPTLTLDSVFKMSISSCSVILIMNGGLKIKSLPIWPKCSRKCALVILINFILRKKN